jgi:glycosyltransferase involved in cell wall biosynthesis
MANLHPEIVHLHTENTELTEFLARHIYPVRRNIYRTLHTSVVPRGILWRLPLRRNPARVSIACSEAVLVAARSYVRGEVTCIPNGIRFSWPVRTSTLSAQYKNPLRLESEFRHYLAIGRMDGLSMAESPKGHDVLIRAWQHAALTARGCRLHFLGDGSLRSDLELLAKDDPGIRFHGVQSNVHEWLIAADCYVMPSRWEGLPIAGLEALGTGLPCVFSDIPQLRALAPPKVYWVPANDVEALSQQLERSLVENIEPSSDEPKSVRSRFGIAGVAERYREVYNRGHAGRA